MSIYPAEIEEVLLGHPSIAGVAIVGLPHATLGETACACLIPKVGATLNLQEVVDFLRPRIAAFKMPERVELFDSFPLTPTMKVQKSVLRDAILSKETKTS